MFIIRPKENDPTRWKLFLNRIYKWKMAGEACMGVVVENGTVLSQTFFCTGDRLLQKVSWYVEL